MACEQASILIVEDDAILSYEWMGGLRARGHHVTHCPTVEAGMLHCLREWPDLIILDAFFIAPTGEMLREGGTSFCADLCRFARETDRSLPLVVGVSGARVSEYLPKHVFDGVPKKLMPLRLKKTVRGERLDRGG